MGWGDRQAQDHVGSILNSEEKGERKIGEQPQRKFLSL